MLAVYTKDNATEMDNSGTNPANFKYPSPSPDVIRKQYI